MELVWFDKIKAIIVDSNSDVLFSLAVAYKRSGNRDLGSHAFVTFGVKD